jgi:hypothetical protein
VQHRTTVVLAALAALATGCSATGEPRQLGVGAPIPIADGVTQTFVPTADGFDAITLWPAFEGQASGRLVVEVDAAGHERSTVVDAAGFEPDQPFRAAFEPVPDSGGEPAQVTVTWSGTPELALLGTRSDAYGDGELTPGPGDLRFVIGHAGRVRGALAAAGQMAGEIGGRATGDPVFTVLWLGVLGALVVAGARPRRSADTDHPR